MLGIIAIFYLDFVRDYVFKNIGFQIYYLQHTNPEGVSSIENYTDSFMENILTDYSISNLVNLKWVFTLVFSTLFGLLGAFINGIFYGTKKVAFYFIILYAILFLTSLLIYSINYIDVNYVLKQNSYLISMEIVHFLQSSLPTLLFIVSYKLSNKLI